MRITITMQCFNDSDACRLYYAGNVPCVFTSFCEQNTNHSYWICTSKNIINYSFPTLVALSLIANTVAILTLTRNDCQIAMANYYKGLTASNILYAFCALLLGIERYMEDTKSYHQTKAYFFAPCEAFWMAGTWITAVIAIESFMTASVRNRLKYICSKSYTSLVVVIIYISCWSCSLPRIWFNMKHRRNTSFTYCDAYRWFTITLSVLLPFPILCVCTILLTITRCQMNKYFSLRKTPDGESSLRNGLGRGIHQPHKSPDEERELIHLNTFLCLGYIFLVLPFSVCQILYVLASDNDKHVYIAVGNILQMALFVNSILQVILYTALVTNFRVKLTKTFTSVSYCCK